MTEYVLVLQAQMETLTKRLAAQITTVEWFTKDFLKNIPDQESIIFEYKREEHDVSKDKGKKELVKDLVGMSNTFEESFIIFGIEKHKNKNGTLITKPGIPLFRLQKFIEDNFSEVFRKYANDVPEIQYGMVVNDGHFYSCLRVRANNFIPIKFDNKIPIREINKKKEVILNYYDDKEEKNIGKFLCLKIPNMRTQKFIWFNCLDKEWSDDFIPNVHLMFDIYPNQQYQLFDYLELPDCLHTNRKKELPKVPKICEFKRYWMDANCLKYRTNRFYTLPIKKLFSENFKGVDPFFIILFYPNSHNDGVELAELIQNILKSDDKFICFTTNYWIEYNATEYNSYFSFLNPQDEFSNNFTYSVSPNCIHYILKDIPSLNYPSKLSTLYRIGTMEFSRSNRNKR